MQLKILTLPTICQGSASKYHYQTQRKRSNGLYLFFLVYTLALRRYNILISIFIYCICVRLYIVWKSYVVLSLQNRVIAHEIKLLKAYFQVCVLPPITARVDSHVNQQQWQQWQQWWNVSSTAINRVVHYRGLFTLLHFGKIAVRSAVNRINCPTCGYICSPSVCYIIINELIWSIGRDLMLLCR